MALPYYIYRVTNSPTLLGLTDFLSQVPALLLGGVGGIIADRADRKRLFIITQSMALVQALLLAVLAKSDHPFIPFIIVLGIILGIINSFDMPVRNALVPLLIESQEDITNAVALVGFMVNISRIVGSSLGGVVIEHFGEYMCFVLNAFSFLFVITLMLTIKTEKKIENYSNASFIQDIKEAVAFITSHQSLLIVFSLFTVVNFLVMPYMILMTIFVRDALNLSAKALGVILSAVGIGAIIIGLVIASIKETYTIKKLIHTPAIATGLLYVLIATIKDYTATVIISVLVGMSLTSSILLTNSYIQLTATEKVRGKLMGIYTSLFIGIAPFGSLFIGLLTDHIGIVRTMILLGISVTVAGIVSMCIFRKVST